MPRRKARVGVRWGVGAIVLWMRYGGGGEGRRERGGRGGVELVHFSIDHNGDSVSYLMVGGSFYFGWMLYSLF